MHMQNTVYSGSIYLYYNYKPTFSQSLYDSVDMKCPEQANLCRQKVDSWLPGPGGLRGKWGVVAYGHVFGGWEGMRKMF